MSDQPQGEVQIVKRGDLEIRIIRPTCISAATCVVYAENTFDLDADNIAIIKDIPDRNLTVNRTAMLCNIIPTINNINPV